MMAPPAKSAELGFSLMEMLVAVALFAMIGMAGVTLVRTVLNAQSGTDDRLARLGQVQRAFYLISTDLQEAAPVSFGLNDDGLVFVRRNLEAQQISIGYSIVDGMLVRTINAARRQPVLTDVTAITWRFHFAGLGWRDTTRIEDRLFPDGVELDLATKSEGALRRVVDLASTP